jgi:hypothetical protein
MTKLLLSALAVALLAGNARADRVAGDVPFKPEPDIWSKAVKKVTAALMRAQGVVLASRVRPGMSAEQAYAILGDACFTAGGPRDSTSLYLELGVWVSYSRRHGAGGGPVWCVTDVTIEPLFR